MTKIVAAALKWHPFVVLVAYGFLVIDYQRYLDGSLKYIRPNMPAAPEDILGHGFWVPWLILVAWFALACFLSYRFGMQRKTGYWVVVVCGFVLLSVADFYLYGVLERQVLAG